MLEAAFALGSPAGPRARLSILIFHRVHARPDPMFPDEPDAARFDALCARLSRWLHVLPLDEAVQRLGEGRLPARAACISFDDGYADNHDVALPILRRHGLTATFFVATGYLDGGRMFNDSVIETVRAAAGPTLDTDGLSDALPARLAIGSLPARRAAVEALIGALKYRPAVERDALALALQQRAGVRELPSGLMMRSAQVRALLRSGMQIGAHTVSHPILARLGDEEARREIVRGRRDLEAIVGAPVTLFAYPNGRPGEDYSARDVRLVRQEGFAAAVSTAWGRSDASSDRFQLPRFTPWDRSPLRFGLRLLGNLRRRPAALAVAA